MDYQLQVITVSVSDVDKATAFYTQQAGFALDVDYYPASEFRHKSPIDDWKGGWQPGTDPQRRDYASIAEFADLDGNTWVIQEIGYRPPRGASSSQSPD